MTVDNFMNHMDLAIDLHEPQVIRLDRALWKQVQKQNGDEDQEWGSSEPLLAGTHLVEKASWKRAPNHDEHHDNHHNHDMGNTDRMQMFVKGNWNGTKVLKTNNTTSVLELKQQLRRKPKAEADVE